MVLRFTVYNTAVSQGRVNKFTLDVAPGLEAPGGLGGLCGMRSRRGGTGGKDVWGGIDIGDGGLSTCKIQKAKPNPY